MTWCTDLKIMLSPMFGKNLSGDQLQLYTCKKDYLITWLINHIIRRFGARVVKNAAEATSLINHGSLFCFVCRLGQRLRSAIVKKSTKFQAWGMSTTLGPNCPRRHDPWHRVLILFPFPQAQRTWRSCPQGVACCKLDIAMAQDTTDTNQELLNITFSALIIF